MSFWKELWGAPDAPTPAPAADAPERKPTRTSEPRPIEQVLEKREPTSSSELGGGKNETVFVKLRDDGAGVFKPKKGEKVDQLKEVRPGTFYRRERAAYLVSRFLDLDLVPPTTIREIDGEIGSIQEFIADAKTGGELSDRQLFDDLVEPEFIKLWLFDYIIYNPDRHGGNFLVKDRKVYAIDNGLAFGECYLSPFYTYYNKPVPQDFIEKINAFLAWEQGQRLLKQFLEELVSAQESAACLWRISELGKMLEKGNIASSDSNRFTYS